MYFQGICKQQLAMGQTGFILAHCQLRLLIAALNACYLDDVTNE